MGPMLVCFVGDARKRYINKPSKIRFNESNTWSRNMPRTLSLYDQKGDGRGTRDATRFLRALHIKNEHVLLLLIREDSVDFGIRRTVLYFLFSMKNKRMLK